MLPLQPPADSPVVRLALVREARRRIASGFYDRDEVRDTVARRVLEEISRG